jgi:hypothetical protein
MWINDFFNNMKWELLKNALLKQGIQPHQLEWVDFNNMEQLNQLAETIVPELIKKNPMMANLIKQNSSMLWADKQKEVVEVINKL